MNNRATSSLICCRKLRQIRHAIITLSIATLLLLSSPSVLAWSSPGHMIIAAIAYRHLPANSRTNVTELLQHHPDYEKWVALYPTNSAFDLPTFIFMRASTWADEIRRHGNLYDHPQWHYVNLPLTPPNFPDLPSPSPTNDILFGIGQCEKVIQDKNASPELRAIYLAWLIHLVGDIHQPLHCVSLVNEIYPGPLGDKGGNGFFVKPGRAGVNLHSIWDKGLGSAVNPRAQYNEAIKISAARSRRNLSELSNDKSLKSWSGEGREIAIESCYLHGTLKGSTTPANAPTLPHNYTKNLKVIAERRAAIAGYRLADEIKKYLR